jgi:hypothetical protein
MRRMWAWLRSFFWFGDVSQKTLRHYARREQAEGWTDAPRWNLDGPMHWGPWHEGGL